MGLTLQEQLLKAGLATKAQAKKANQAKRNKQRQGKKDKRAEPTGAELQQQQERAEKAARDRELNDRMNQARRQREIAAQIKQLVEANRIPRSPGDDDVAFYFENKGKAKKLHVAPDVHQKISQGRLVIVNFNGVFELVPADIADKIRRRNPSLVIELPEEQSPDADDPYAAYQVPDDLTW